MHPANFIVDQNRFHLSGPPQWWLDKLWDFDNSLVVVPSRQGFFYRLAQRRPLLLPEKMVNDMLFKESDTKMLASYSLVPVTTIVATANWSNPYIWVDLAGRAPHRMGGAEKAAQLAEEQDRKVEEAKQAGIDNMLNVLSKDAWGMYNKKLGVRSSMYVPHTKGSSKPASKAPSFRIINSSKRDSSNPVLNTIFTP